jgi:hypothetical protein
MPAIVERRVAEERTRLHNAVLVQSEAEQSRVNVCLKIASGPVDLFSAKRRWSMTVRAEVCTTGIDARFIENCSWGYNRLCSYGTARWAYGA